MRRRVRAAAAAALLGLAAGCASVQPPPGGQDDERPPQIVSVTPEPLAPISDLETPVIFRFDERISERGLDERSVLVSPRTGRFGVEKERSAIKVEPAGGWAPELVYRVVLLPGIQDLFGNARTEGAELVFSTGPPIPNTALAGTVSDRITGRPLEGAFVEALRMPDSLSYVALADSGGFFAIRHLPPGPYLVRAFRDANRNLRLDEFEDRAVEQLTVGVSDTVLTTLGVLARDTTPARLAQANAEDTLAIRLLFDDYLDPTMPLEGVRAELFRLPDTAAVADTATPARPPVRDTVPVPVDTLLFPREYGLLVAARDSARMAAEAAAADTVARDTVAPDTAAADTAAAPPAKAPPPRRAAPADTSSLPTRELILVPGRPLVPEGRYAVLIREVTNIAGIPRGGGEAELTVPRPEPPDTAERDTAAAPPDTVPPDTSAAALDTLPPDTAGAPPDTVPPDTSALPPDTVPPDTSAAAPDAPRTRAEPGRASEPGYVWRRRRPRRR